MLLEGSSRHLGHKLEQEKKLVCYAQYLFHRRRSPFHAQELGLNVLENQVDVRAAPGAFQGHW